MDLIYIITHPFCCFTNDPWLEDRSLLIDDRRLLNSRLWAQSEKGKFTKEKRKHEGPRPWTKIPWTDAVFEKHLADDADKSLVLINYNPTVADILDKRLAEDYYDERGDRLLILSFFHNDEDTAQKLDDWYSPKERLAEKNALLALFKERHPYIIIREIPFDFTLSASWLMERFEEYILGKQF